MATVRVHSTTEASAVRPGLGPWLALLLIVVLAVAVVLVVSNVSDEHDDPASA